MVDYCLPREVDETRLVCFERYAAPTRPLFCVRDNRVPNRLCVLLYIVAYHLCLEVVDETEDFAVPSIFHSTRSAL
jgi:hypothetical protein